MSKYIVKIRRIEYKEAEIEIDTEKEEFDCFEDMTKEEIEEDFYTYMDIKDDEYILYNADEEIVCIKEID